MNRDEFEEMKRDYETRLHPTVNMTPDSRYSDEALKESGWEFIGNQIDNGKVIFSKGEEYLVVQPCKYSKAVAQFEAHKNGTSRPPNGLWHMSLLKQDIDRADNLRAENPAIYLLMHGHSDGTRQANLFKTWPKALEAATR